MKTIFKLLATALLLLTTVQAPAQSWQWGKRGGSSGAGSGASAQEKVIDMATDQHGNIYVAAINNPGSIANVDGHTGVGPWDRISVASWSCNGEFRWMKSFGSGMGAGAVALGVDTLGGVYITGGISSISGAVGGPGYFDTDSVLPYMAKQMYMIKYDTSGVFQWLKMPEPDTSTFASFGGSFDMDVAPNGDLYLYALLIPGLWDGGAFSVADTGVYVWKMNSAGVFQSLAKLDVTVSGDMAHEYGYMNLSPLQAHFKRDHHLGRYYLGGWVDSYYGTLTIGATPVEGALFLAAFGPDGSALWTKLQDSTGHGVGIYTRPLTDGHGNVYISGAAGPGGSFGGHVFTNSLGINAVPVLIALDSNGNMKWATSGEATGATAVYGSAYINNTIAVTGRHGLNLQWQGLSVSTPINKHYIYLARFNAATGAIIGLDSIAANTINNNASAMAADNKGNFYVGGRFASGLYVASDTLYKNGGTYDWFVAKFGTANCNCTLPLANFSYSTSGTAIHFSYTGSGDYSSISWDFGDGATSSLPNPSHTFSDTGSHMVCVTVINDCGSNIYCLEVAAPTGIENTGSAAAGVKVYPNPASQSITVAGARSGSKLSLYDVTGALVLEQSLHSSLPVSLNISHLPDGVYVLQFTDSKGKRGMTRVVKR